ncbi:MAG: EamA family transporter [Pseudomonadales bacterium]
MAAAQSITWLWVAVTIALTVLGQTLQKLLATRAPLTGSLPSWRYYLGAPLFWGAVACLAGALLSWLAVLADMPVGKAYPLLGANYVAMLVVARLKFGERVPTSRWLGVALIVAGLFLVSSS